MEKVLRPAQNRMLLYACLKVSIIASLCLLLVNAQVMSQGASFTNVKLTEIKKLELCNLPEPMVHRIKSLAPDQMLRFKEEYQETVEDESGEQFVKTIQLRFVDDNIMGYIKTAPLLQSSNSIVNNVQIKVPILWGCIPGVGHSQQHTAWGFAEMQNFSQVEMCTGWHQMKDGERLIPPMPKAKRKKLLGLF
jgi:hypothetical protein